MNFLTDIQDSNPIMPQEGGNHCKVAKIEYVTYVNDDATGEALDVTFVEQIAGTPTSRIRLFRPATEAECETDKDKKNMRADYSRIVGLFNSFIKGGMSPAVLETVSITEAEKLAGVTPESKGITFKKIIDTFLSQLPQGYNSIPVVIKFIYDNKNNLTIPRYGSFISSEFHPRKFQYNPEYDFLKPQIVKKKDNAGGSTGTMGGMTAAPLPANLF